MTRRLTLALILATLLAVAARPPSAVRPPEGEPTTPSTPAVRAGPGGRLGSLGASIAAVQVRPGRPGDDPRALTAQALQDLSAVR
ncbi:MAG TPA: hypothetical protein VG370_10100, partial [Chloroflexota bacterium]|nr:hypothetical protein [Chloroflexota bacterium]